MSRKLLVATLAALVLLFAGLQVPEIAKANPMDYSPPKPATPEFTLQYADNSYNVAGNLIQNKSIEVTIKNQPTGYVLCYNVKLKNHFSENWTTYEYYSNSTYLTPHLFIPNRLLAGNSTTTVLTFGVEGNNGSDTYSLTLGKVNGGDQIDFQVQAYIGNWFPGRMVNATASIDYYLLNIDATGDWSPTQTVTIPASNNSSPNPTVPELQWVIVLPLFAVVFLVALKFKVKSRFPDQP